jgi:hypothetical protein
MLVGAGGGAGRDSMTYWVCLTDDEGLFRQDNGIT